MTSIHSSDLVLASAIYGGRTLATLSGTGFESITDVLKAIRASLGSFAGLIELTVRNASQGWRQRRSMFVAPLRPGIQLTLF